MSQNTARHRLTRLGLTLLIRDWRRGELNVLMSAILVGVATVTSIALFTDRIGSSIIDEAGSLLAGDAQITGSQPIPTQWRDEAKNLGLELADITRFQAMSFGHDNAMQLSSVRAVSSNYPLKGQLEVSDELFGQGIKVSTGPDPGEAWVNSRLLASLDLTVGDSIGVGDADFTVARVLLSEPDSAGSSMGFSPRVLINAADIGKTGAVQTGSRVFYTLTMLGDVSGFYQYWKGLPSEHHRWRNVADANERITETLQRAQSFLLLAGALGVILAGVALALAARRYALRQLGHVAVLKTLGLTPKDITGLYARNMMIFGLIFVVIGLVLGWFLHWAFLSFVADLLPRSLVPASYRPYVIGLVTGFISLLAFVLPPIWVLRQAAPSRVLRSDIAGGQLTTMRTSLIGVIAVIALIYFYSSSLTITAVLVIAGAVAIVGVAVVAQLLIRVLRRYASRFGTTWRLGLSSLQRNNVQNGFQIMIFSIALMLLFILTLLRTTLLTQWQNQLPVGTPNHFAFNIFESDKEGLVQYFNQYGIASTEFYPMIRGRLIDVAGESIQDRLTRLNPDGDDFLRELNITWSQTLAADNEVVEGQWFDKQDADSALKISIEQEFAQALDIQRGDELTISFGGQDIKSTVDNIRTVQWDSFTPNFYIIFNKPILNGMGAAYLTSFFLAPSQKPLLVDILKQYPTITVIDVDLVLNQVQSIISQVTIAIEFILALVLIAGFIVLVASIQATLDSRLKESAILRTIGARAGVVRGALAIEFMTLGGLAGVLAATGAQIALYFLQTRLLNMDFNFSWSLMLIGPLVGLTLIGSVGLLSTWKVTRVPPLRVLRNL